MFLLINEKKPSTIVSLKNKHDEYIEINNKIKLSAYGIMMMNGSVKTQWS